MRIEVDRQSVTRDYYRLLQPRLVAGRLPTDDELANDAPVIVVSERLARAYWRDGQALGNTLVEFDGTEPYRVIGIVKDVRWFSWDRDVPSFYVPYARTTREPTVTLLIRTSSNTARVIADTLKALEAADPLLKPRRAAPLDDLFVDSVRKRRFQAWLFGSFAIGGLIVVGTGIFGLLAMATARRTRELGIRQALGSTQADLVRLLTAEQLRPVFAGIVVGGLVVFWAVRFVEGFLYRVTSGDPRVWAVAALVTLATAGLGVMVPALRASRTDPVQALRVE